MKILVTGGAGYIGSHTCVELLQTGYEVVVVDNFDNSKPEAIRRIEELANKSFSFYEADVRDEKKLREIFAKEHIDAVIHFAGLKAVGESVQVPLKYYNNNLISTLVLLDVMMPGMDGFTLCRKIRERESVPVLFLTARVLEEDQLRGYELGADDYILKPFSLRVLLAKCQAVLERYQCGMQAEQQKGLWKHEKRQQFFCDGQPVELQSLDFRLLSYFYENPNRILTREQIILKLWGYEYAGNDRSVDTHVKNLRKALGDYGSCIRTIVKKGYIFERNKTVKEQTGEGQEG